MQKIDTRRHTGLFVGCILLASLCHMLQRSGHPFLDTLLNCANFSIYLGLLLSWSQSVRRRLLPSRARRYMLSAADFMLLLFLLRSVRSRISKGAVSDRYFWYAYYVPIVMIATLFLLACICFDVRRKKRPDERLLLIPAGLIVLGIMTNDLHFLAFRPLVEMQRFYGDSGDYVHGPLFYAAYAWAGICVAAGLGHLRHAVHRRRVRLWASPFLFVALWIGLLVLLFALEKADLPRPFQMPELTIFCMVGCFETCIRQRLMPHNEDYAGFFGSMRLPALITDRDLNPVWESSAPLTVTREQKAAALTGPVELGNDVVLYGAAIDAGASFWTRDEGTIRRLNEELEDANDTLALENELLEREREQIAERAAVEERNALYEKAALAVYPAQKKIDALLSRAEPDTPAFRPLIGHVAALTAYVKRKSNFVMLSAQRDAVTAEELGAAIGETAHYYAYCGLRVTLDSRTVRDFSCREAMDVFDTLEAVLEALRGISEDCLVRLEDGRLTCMTDGETPPELPETPLPVTARAEDGQILLTVRWGGEAA